MSPQTLLQRVLKMVEKIFGWIRRLVYGDDKIENVDDIFYGPHLPEGCGKNFLKNLAAKQRRKENKIEKPALRISAPEFVPRPLMAVPPIFPVEVEHLENDNLSLCDSVDLRNMEELDKLATNLNPGHRGPVSCDLEESDSESFSEVKRKSLPKINKIRPKKEKHFDSLPAFCRYLKIDPGEFDNHTKLLVKDGNIKGGLNLLNEINKDFYKWKIYYTAVWDTQKSQELKNEKVVKGKKETKKKPFKPKPIKFVPFVPVKVDEGILKKKVETCNQKVAKDPENLRIVYNSLGFPFVLPKPLLRESVPGVQTVREEIRDIVAKIGEKEPRHLMTESEKARLDDFLNEIEIRSGKSTDISTKEAMQALAKRDARRNKVEVKDEALRVDKVELPKKLKARTPDVPKLVAPPYPPVHPVKETVAVPEQAIKTVLPDEKDEDWVSDDSSCFEECEPPKVMPGDLFSEFEKRNPEKAEVRIGGKTPKPKISPYAYKGTDELSKNLKNRSGFGLTTANAPQTVPRVLRGKDLGRPTRPGRLVNKNLRKGN